MNLYRVKWELTCWNVGKKKMFQKMTNTANFHAIDCENKTAVFLELTMPW